MSWFISPLRFGSILKCERIVSPSSWDVRYGMRHIFVGQNFARISNFIFILRLDAISAFERFGLDVNGGTA